MANLIEGVNISNPFGVVDLCSHIRVTEDKSTLVISDCMPYVSTYSFQFWARSTTQQIISFKCDSTFKKFTITNEWQRVSIVFDVTKICNIYLEFPRGQYWIYNTKLEMGKYHTDWSPHPEDSTALLDARFEDIQQMLVSQESIIENTRSLVDKVNQEILNGVSKTTFESTIYGLTNNMNSRFNNIEDGYGKWYLSIFDKSKFRDTKADDTIDDRERIDMGIFALDNAEIAPIEEMLVDDDSIAMRVDARGKILHYIGWAKFSQAIAVTIRCSHHRGTLYLNGRPVLSAENLDTDSVILNFGKGWNLLEIVGNESNFSFGSKISEMPECEVFNCLMGVPTNRSAKVRSQGAYLNIYLDKIISEVFDTESEIIDGVEHVVRIKGSKITQTNDAIEFLVHSVTEEGSDQSTFEITSQGIQAITDKFVIKDVEGNAVIIEEGQILANAITTDMLNTDAIKSTNYQPWVLPEQIVDEDTGELLPLSDEDYILFSQAGTHLELDTGNIYSPNFVLDNENNTAYFRGNIYATDGIFNGVVNATSGVFRGAVFAERGEFNGTVNASSGTFRGTVYATNGKFTGELESDIARLGPWTLNSTSLFKGSGTFAMQGSNNIYLGNSGFSLSDKFVYDSVNGTLKLSIDSLSITGQSLYEAVTENGNRIYYTSTTPTMNNLPVSEWINNAELDVHINDLCYNKTDGKIYTFVQKRARRFKIKFNASTDIRPSDYVDIYFLKNKTMHRVTSHVIGSGAVEIVIPVPDFYIHWHTASGAADSYWGFQIESVTAVPVTTQLSSYYSPVNLPQFSVDESLNVGQYPESEHPYLSVDQDKLWKVSTGLNSELQYEWEEIENQELISASENLATVMSYLHYDTVNGLILYDGTCTLPDKILDSQDFANVQNALNGNIRLTSNGMDVYKSNQLLARYGNKVEIYNNNSIVAEYGQETKFYIPGDQNQTVASSVGSNGLNIRYGSITIGDFTTFSSTGSGFYVGNDGKMKVGNDSSYIIFDGNNISISADGVDIVGMANNLNSQVQTAVDNYVSENVSTIVEGISDNLIQTYYQSTNPAGTKNSSGNYTSWRNGWETDAKRGKHEGDLWYDTINEKYYRYTAVTGNATTSYDWEEMKATPPQQVFDDIDGKATIFVGSTEPTNANVGDLWFKSASDPIKTYVQTGTDTYEWQEYNKYTDDTKANKALSYFHYDTTNGLILYDGTCNLPDEVITSQNFANLGSSFKGNIRLTEHGMDVYSGNNLLTSYGSTAVFYIPNTTDIATRIDQYGLNILKGTISIGTLTGLDFANSNQYGLYVSNNGSFTAGNSSSYIKFNGQSLELNVDSLNIGNGKIQDIIRGSSYTKNTFYGTVAPTMAVYPAKDWVTAKEMISHVGDTYYNTSNGKLYRFKQSDIGKRYKIFISSRTQTIDSDDYVCIYCYYNQQLNKYGPYTSGQNVVIPSEDFYIYWHNKARTGTQTGVYGFSINSVTAVSSSTALSASTVVASLPDYQQLFVDLSNLPETEHNYSYTSAADILWYVNTDLGSSGDYEWTEIQNTELTQATANISTASSTINRINSYFHYDSTNGLILFDGTCSLPNKTLEEEDFAEVQSTLKGNIRLTSDGLGIYNGNQLLSSFGATAYFYVPGSNNVVATSIDQNGLNIVKGSINIGNGNFSVTNRGILSATGASIGGTITAGSGSSFGPWTISDDGIWRNLNNQARQNNQSILGNENYLYFGTDGISLTDKFTVDDTGKLDAKVGRIGFWWFTDTHMIYNSIDPNSPTTEYTYIDEITGEENTTYAAQEDVFSIGVDGMNCYDIFSVDVVHRLVSLEKIELNHLGTTSDYRSKITNLAKATYSTNLKLLCLNSSNELMYASVSDITGSSIKYKNIDRLLTQDDIEKFYDIRPVIASYKDDYIGEDHYWHSVKMPMLIAEDIEKVFPGAVQYTEDGQVDNYTDHLVVSVHQQMLIDQRNKIEEQQKEIDDLKEKLNKILEKLGD